MALIYKYLFLLLLFVNFSFLNAQETESLVNADTSIHLQPMSSIWRSALLPGWGQIHQERLAQAFFFYISATNFYYNAFFHLYHYNKGHAPKHLYLFRYHFSAALFVHLVNLIDVTDTAFRLKPTGWQGGLLNDKPLKSPWGAALRSAIMPGWGQIYTKSYWKAAGYMAVDGYLFYKIRQADIRYRSSREIKFRDDRSRYSWYFGLAYFITIADAYANAYLYRFDDAVRLTVAPQSLNEQVGFGIYVFF